jgi:hypothetical protein
VQEKEKKRPIRKIKKSQGIIMNISQDFSTGIGL